MASKKDMRVNCLNELRKNTVIIDATFEKIGLQVVKQSWQMHDAYDGGLICYLEVMGSLDNVPVDCNQIFFQSNLYDTDGDIIYSESTNVYKNEFVGYDTYRMYFTEKDTIDRAVSARVFAGLGWAR